MGKFILLSKNKNGDKRYISNTSPLLWTDNKSEAKIFRSEGEMMLDLSAHRDILQKMVNELGLIYYLEQVE